MSASQPVKHREKSGDENLSAEEWFDKAMRLLREFTGKQEEQEALLYSPQTFNLIYFQDQITVLQNLLLDITAYIDKAIEKGYRPEFRVFGNLPSKVDEESEIDIFFDASAGEYSISDVNVEILEGQEAIKSLEFGPTKLIPGYIPSANDTEALPVMRSTDAMQIKRMTPEEVGKIRTQRATLSFREVPHTVKVKIRITGNIKGSEKSVAAKPLEYEVEVRPKVGKVIDMEPREVTPQNNYDGITIDYTTEFPNQKVEVTITRRTVNDIHQRTFAVQSRDGKGYAYTAFELEQGEQRIEEGIPFHPYEVSLTPIGKGETRGETVVKQYLQPNKRFVEQLKREGAQPPTITDGEWETAKYCYKDCENNEQKGYSRYEVIKRRSLVILAQRTPYYPGYPINVCLFLASEKDLIEASRSSFTLEGSNQKVYPYFHVNTDTENGEPGFVAYPSIGKSHFAYVAELRFTVPKDVKQGDVIKISSDFMKQEYQDVPLTLKLNASRS